MKRISASQLELFGRCERRWAFSYRAGKKEPFTGAAQAGTEVHAVLEHQGPWDKEWTAPDTGKTYPVGQMARLLQAQSPEGVVAREKRFEVEVEGVPLVGVVDFYSERVIGDFKTTSKVRNAKSVAKLTEDPQRLMYTEFVPTAEKTVWLYGAWDTMIVTPREVAIDRKADKERFKLKVLQPADRMLSIPDDVDPLSLKPNVNDCALFPKDGCPHKNECFPPGKFLPQVTNSKESDVAMQSLIERLRAKAAAEGQPVIPAQPVPVPAPAVSAPEPAPAAVVPAPAAVAQPEPAAEPAAPKMAPALTTVDTRELTPAAPEPAEPKKRGRKSKAELAQAVADAAPAEPASEHIVGTLFIDCLPLTESFTSAFSLINAAAEEVQNDMQVPHFGLVDFAKGGPALAAQLRANLSGKRIDRLYVETRSAEGKAVLNVLTSIAQHVVRGVF